MKREQLVCFILVTGIFFCFPGCYTQFRTLEKQQAIENDTLSGSIRDTVREREYCYWERNFFGEWELKCYRTNYPDRWFSYHNRPWWYHNIFNDPNFDPYDCHCPYHTFYHPNCEMCWYYCDKWSMIHPHPWDTTTIHPVVNTKPPKVGVQKGTGGMTPHPQGKILINQSANPSGISVIDTNTQNQQIKIQEIKKDSIPIINSNTTPVNKIENKIVGDTVKDVAPPVQPGTKRRFGRNY